MNGSGRTEPATPEVPVSDGAAARMASVYEFFPIDRSVP
jgi:hypothetical protein